MSKTDSSTSNHNLIASKVWIFKGLINYIKHFIPFYPLICRSFEVSETFVNHIYTLEVNSSVSFYELMIHTVRCGFTRGCLWIIQSNRDTVSGKTRCPWVFANVFFSKLWTPNTKLSFHIYCTEVEKEVFAWPDVTGVK